MHRDRLVAIGTVIAGCLLVGAVIGLHSLIGNDDTWSAPIQAMSTLALVCITGWYAYTAHTAPRRAAHEAIRREVSRYIARNRQAIWTAVEFFPIDEPPAELPDMVDLFKSRDAIRAIRDRMLEYAGLLPREQAGMALGVAACALDAEDELHALGAAILDENQAGHAEGRDHVTWDGIRAAHFAASGDPSRRQPWVKLLAGESVKATAERWDELSSAVDRDLTG